MRTYDLLSGDIGEISPLTYWRPLALRNLVVALWGAATSGPRMRRFDSRQLTVVFCASCTTPFGPRLLQILESLGCQREFTHLERLLSSSSQ